MKIDELLIVLVERGGSDLHIKAGLPPAIRRNGHLEPLADAGRMSPEAVKTMLAEIMSEEQRVMFETDPHARYELDFAYSIQGKGRFRFNVHKQRGSLGAVARSLACSIPRLETLGLPESVGRMTQARKGLALVTGPTGSGKSTTLAAIIDRINETRPDHIITIEDPIEYIHNTKQSYIMQREVGQSADTLSFKNALKSALRQDPDVILIGEMRDYETIGIAITSAETGHLVFGTLHTNSAAQTIGRIIDVFPSDQVEQVKTQLAGNLFGVLAQILFARADGKGRACACEIMFANTAIRNNIRSNNIDAIYQSIQTGQKEGMQTMDMSILGLVREGKVTAQAVFPFVRDECSKRQLVELAGNSLGGATDFSSAGVPSPTQPTPSVTNSVAGGNGEKPRRLGSMIVPPWEKQ